MPDTIDKLRFPVGKYEAPESITEAQIKAWIKIIGAFPAQIKERIAGLSQVELTWKYRTDGWNIRQLIHHCADSHMNSMIRFKLALTERQPAIKPYLENYWAEMIDSTLAPVEWSISILDGLHKRWVFLLESLNEEELERIFVHPEYGHAFRLDGTIGLYAWHCEHHLAHLEQALKGKGKY